MNRSRTKLLLTLLTAAGALAVLSTARMQSARENALSSERDLIACRREMADLARWRGAATATPAKTDDPALNRQLRRAATIAGIADALVSIEPGQPARLGDTAYTETPVYLRMNAITLRQLVTFLRNLSANDPGVRARSIELSPPQDQAVGSPDEADQTAHSDELWTGDVSLAYLSFPPETRAK